MPCASNKTSFRMPPNLMFSHPASSASHETDCMAIAWKFVTCIQLIPPYNTKYKKGILLLLHLREHQYLLCTNQAMIISWPMNMLNKFRPILARNHLSSLLISFDLPFLFKVQLQLQLIVVSRQKRIIDITVVVLVVYVHDCVPNSDWTTA